MTGTVDPMELLAQWSDHWRYADMHKMLHPGLADAALYVVGKLDDATVCMAALVAMIRRSDLVIAEADSEQVRATLARCRAVADVCGRLTSTYTVGERTVVRFEMQSVSA